MYYFRLVLEDDSEIFYENKSLVSDNRIVRNLLDLGELSPHDEIKSIEEITEEKFEEGMINQ